MNERVRFVVIILAAFGSAIGGVLIGRAWIAPATPVETELHQLLHGDLRLDADQERKIEAIEQQYA